MAKVTKAARLAIQHPMVFGTHVRWKAPNHALTRYRNLTREVRKLRPATIVEIGVWRGDQSVRMIREALRHRDDVTYWGFDLFEKLTPEQIAAEASSLQPATIDEVRGRLAQFPASVHLIAGDSVSTVPAAGIGSADLVFIDGGHSYSTVSADWKNVRQLVHRGSTVVFDDYTNAEAEEQEAFGVRRVVDEIDLNSWDVEILHPADYFERPWGVLRSEFARVTPLPAKGSEVNNMVVIRLAPPTRSCNSSRRGTRAW